MQLKVIWKDTSWISICIVCLFSSSILSILYFCLFESFTVSQSSVMFWTTLHTRHTIPSSSYRWKSILIFQNMCSLNILNNLDYHQGPKHRNHLGSQFSVFSNWLDPSFFPSSESSIAFCVCSCDNIFSLSSSISLSSLSDSISCPVGLERQRCISLLHLRHLGAVQSRY